MACKLNQDWNLAFVCTGMSIVYRTTLADFIVNIVFPLKIELTHYCIQTANHLIRIEWSQNCLSPSNILNFKSILDCRNQIVTVCIQWYSIPAGGTSADLLKHSESFTLSEDLLLQTHGPFSNSSNYLLFQAELDKNHCVWQYSWVQTQCCGDKNGFTPTSCQQHPIAKLLSF